MCFVDLKIGRAGQVSASVVWDFAHFFIIVVVKNRRLPLFCDWPGVRGKSGWTPTPSLNRQLCLFSDLPDQPWSGLVLIAITEYRQVPIFSDCNVALWWPVQTQSIFS